MTDQTTALLARLGAPDPPPFALLHRPGATGPDRVDLLVGDVCTVDRLADLPVPPADLPVPPAEPATTPSATPSAGPSTTPSAGPSAEPVPVLLALVPYRQLAERGFGCHDDGTPLQALSVRQWAVPTVAAVLRAIPDRPTTIRDAGYDLTDAAYADLVRAVVANEIGRGEGSNFVLKRSFQATIEDYATGAALAIFRRLLQAEFGSHWTFLVHTGDRTLVGASPERHVTLADGVATMNPISGTFRYPPGGADLADLLAFLADRKESDELYMVLDEELKMMARVCRTGGRVLGPWLKPMARLAHTEYLIEGRTDLDAREILRLTMFAPTVTGSPLESACQVIPRYEHTGRGYYGGVLALFGRDGAGRQTLDSAIAIRTADIEPSGRLRIDVGATLVRHSRPDGEAAETRAKAAGLLAAFGAGAGGSVQTAAGSVQTAAGAEPTGAAPASSHWAAQHWSAGHWAAGHWAAGHWAAGHWAADAQVRAALDRRNATMSRFWLQSPRERGTAGSALAGRRVLIVDCEDNFTYMISHQLAAAGLAVTVRPHTADVDPDAAELLVVGPGPGDPRAAGEPKIATMRRLIGDRLAAHRPLLTVCLGHQVLCDLIGLELVRRRVPNQGTQREIDLFGRRERCGFYNTFAAVSAGAEVAAPMLAGPLAVARDPQSGEVHALRGPGLYSLQFHPESVLTEHGPAILAAAVDAVLTPAAVGAPAGTAFSVGAGPVFR